MTIKKAPGTSKGLYQANRCLRVDLPLTDYMEALELQRSLVRARSAGSLTRDVLMMLEHPPVFTLGRRGNRQGLLVSEEILAAKGIPVVHVERGGDVTYHGPGQVMLYPIIDLKTTRWGVTEFVDTLEEIMIRTGADWGIKAERNPLNRGVWVRTKKLGSVGIAVRRSISFHGLALNVNTDLHPFTWIHPCGLTGCLMTSMKEEVGRDISMEDVRGACALHAQEIFRIAYDRVSLEYLYALLDNEGERIIDDEPCGK